MNKTRPQYKDRIEVKFKYNKHYSIRHVYFRYISPGQINERKKGPRTVTLKHPPRFHKGQRKGCGNDLDGWGGGECCGEDIISVTHLHCYSLTFDMESRGMLQLRLVDGEVSIKFRSDLMCAALHGNESWKDPIPDGDIITFSQTGPKC